MTQEDPRADNPSTTVPASQDLAGKTTPSSNDSSKRPAKKNTRSSI